MQNLPTAEIYKQELEYMPWGKVLTNIHNHVGVYAKVGGRVLDIMCGPGSLLGMIKKNRPDLECLGLDFEGEYIRSAQAAHPGITFQIADALTWNSRKKFNVVLCTAGVHHLPDGKQQSFVKKLATLVAPKGFAIIADPYIRDFKTHQQRLLCAAELGYEYLVETIRNGAPAPVIDAAVQVLRNDVLQVEWKTSQKRMQKMLKRHFKVMYCAKVWPNHHNAEWGDHYFVLHQK